ncbi:DUF5304 family protein [Microbispora sp. RL4-1S]|uniref:DUF5304 family protein n=1 Tax=Microbispora oryzae TaxID=2806554 RepID=A0A940WKZ1_9ACTN|nr:DUF5304 family protein [Microbispora oryzae]MBP2702459.1 DUF5304 family protein [Microbispora oryzae]
MTEPTESGSTNGSGDRGESGPRHEDRRQDRRQDPLGSAAEEAMKLFDAVQQRVGREIGKGLVKGGVSGIGAVFGGSGAGGGGRGRGGDVWSEAVAEGHDDGYICRACPVCRVIAARRESGGDVADHLFAAGGELFAAFRQAVDALQRPPAHSSAQGPGQGSGHGREAGQGGSDRPGGSRVEHIDLG